MNQVEKEARRVVQRMNFERFMAETAVDGVNASRIWRSEKAHRKNVRRKLKAQRAKRGFSDLDVMDAGTWFAREAHDQLVEMRRECVEVPLLDEQGEYLTEDFFGLNIMQIVDGPNDAASVWLNILDRLIYLSGELGREVRSVDLSGMDGAGGVGGTDKGCETGEAGQSDLLDALSRETPFERQCTTEFFELFSKYFYSFWGIDEWVTKTVPKVLIALAQKVEYYPDMIENEEEETASSRDDRLLQKWKDTLLLMAALGVLANPENEFTENEYLLPWLGKVEEYREKYAEKRTNRAFFFEDYLTDDERAQYEEMTKKYNDRRHEMEAEASRCKDEFFRLFSKYFWELWY